MPCRAEVWQARVEPAGQAGLGEEAGIRNGSLDGHWQQSVVEDGLLWSFGHH